MFEGSDSQKPSKYLAKKYAAKNTLSIAKNTSPYFWRTPWLSAKVLATNGADLSRLRGFLSVGAGAVSNFFEGVAVACEELVIFGPSLDGSWLLTKGTPGM